MSKHTPAPWIVVESDDAPVARPAAWICTLGNNPDDPAVFSTAMDGDKFIFGDKLADARLIAAAPDMLEALKKLDGHLSILMGNIHGSAKVDHRWEGMEHVVRGWRDDIQAVTAKAEARS